MTNLEKNNIVIYKAKNKEIKVNLEGEKIWLNQKQISELFAKDQSVISRHINNVFKENEVLEKSNMQKMHNANSDKPVNFYSLDVILSVGYRTNSEKAIDFRKWSTQILKQHLIKGYTINQKRLQEHGLNEFEQAIKLIKKTITNNKLENDEAKGLLSIVTDYANSWLLLQKYDEDKLAIPKTKKASFELTYEFAQKALKELKSDLLLKKQATELFGQERDKGLQSIIGNIYQTFAGDELYPSISDKAAHLLYFVIKDHPLADGNKRTGAFLFILFLAKNNYLLDKNGERKFNDNALVAIALLVAESNPKQKDIMIKLIQNFIV
mgnify:CR=1 FL=1